MVYICTNRALDSADFMGRAEFPEQILCLDSGVVYCVWTLEHQQEAGLSARAEFSRKGVGAHFAYLCGGAA